MHYVKYLRKAPAKREGAFYKISLLTVKENILT